MNPVPEQYPQPPIQETPKAPELPGMQPDAVAPELPIAAPEAPVAPPAAAESQPVTPIDTRVPVELKSLKDPLLAQVEKLMSEDLADVYKELTPAQQQEFKMKGEAIAMSIAADIKSGKKFQHKKLFNLLTAWYKLLPGVLSPYIHQEAKHTIDKIEGLHEHPNLVNKSNK